MALLEPSTTHSPDMRKSVNDHFHAPLGLCWSNGTTFEMQSMRVCLKGVVGKLIRTIPSIALKKKKKKECDNSFNATTMKLHLSRLERRRNNETCPEKIQPNTAAPLKPSLSR